jgi:predicted RNA methylase
LESLKTQTERNKLGQFATPNVLATDILEYAKTLLPTSQQIRFLDPAFGTGAFYSALLRVFPSLRITKAWGYEIDPHHLFYVPTWDARYKEIKAHSVLSLIILRLQRQTYI